MPSFDEKLKTLLKTENSFVDQDGDLLEGKLQDAARNADEKLIKLLITDEEMRNKFFSEIAGYQVFNGNLFIEYIGNKNFLDNSYTKFKNKIGLQSGGKFLKESGDISLVWPFKDCVLEGGQDKEEQKKKEIFFNEVLAQDEIDKLFAPKVLTNFKKYDKDGEHQIDDFTRDENQNIIDNFIIKGNNLLALHTIKKEFKSRINLIYIDPPYNTGGDGFNYNDSFNHSTWLTFMKNRLEVAKELLAEDGVIYISIDHHENHYLKVLCDEIFKEGFIQDIVVETAAPAGFKLVNPGPVKVTEYVLVYAKNKAQYVSKEKKLYVEGSYPENYNQYIKNIDEEYGKWNIINIKQALLDKKGFKTEKELKDRYGDAYENVLNYEIEQFALQNANSIFTTYKPHNPAPKLKEICDLSQKNKGKIYSYEDKYYVLNGRLMAFYSSKLKEVDGKMVPTTHLTNLWNDISWSGVSSEGGVMLNNAKKPEKLLKRIIELATNEGDIVLDFHLGSGTTAAVAHKMRRQYIGIEQLDYGENDSLIRLKNVINGDTSGISEAVNRQGGGEVIYCELKKYNQGFIDKIEEAKDIKELLKIRELIKEKAYFKYNFDMQKFEESLDEFKDRPLTEQKELLIEILNKNQLYVNLSDIDDEDFQVSEEDKKLNDLFYNN